MSNYPDGISEGSPDAPWNEGDAREAIMCRWCDGVIEDEVMLCPQSECDFDSGELNEWEWAACIECCPEECCEESWEPSRRIADIQNVFDWLIRDSRQIGVVCPELAREVVDMWDSYFGGWYCMGEYPDKGKIKWLRERAAGKC